MLNNLKQNNNEKKGKIKEFFKKPYLYLVIIMLISLVFIFQCSKPTDTKQPINQPSAQSTSDSNFVLDGDASDIQEVDKSEITESLNQKVEEGMIAISINSNPKFTVGNTEGYVNVINSETNNYPQYFEIYEDETGELLYKSNVIPIGKRIANISLNKQLPKGNHICTVYFNSVNMETQTVVGTAAAKITISVLDKT